MWRFDAVVDHSPIAADDSARGRRERRRARSPDFKEWPAWNDITHQKMWVDWIRRSYKGGLRVMVALAVNNKTLSSMVAGIGDSAADDKSSADLQITEIKSFVAHHADFMEIALTATDLERIIRNNKLAVVIGVEIDNPGNLNTVASLTQAQIAAEIDRLYNEGVRYIFPIHLVDNPFGGTAVYQSLMNYSNILETGHWWDLECDPNSSFHFQPLGVGMIQVVQLKLKVTLGPPPAYPCATNTGPPNQLSPGQINKRGLTPGAGDFAIKTMMRHGMLIDIDHMSNLAKDATLKIGAANGYPLNSGHSTLYVSGGTGTERNMTAEQYMQVRRLHGMVGVGTSGTNAFDWANECLQILKAVGASPLDSSQSLILSLGTDTNGISPGMPPRRTVSLKNQAAGAIIPYSDSLPRSTLGTKSWDYNTEGVAHYGMLPEFLQDVKNATHGAALVDGNLMFGADYFLQTWKICEAKRSSIK